MIRLADADAAALQGKTVALTIHERPSFSAMTAGKAGFGLLGGLAMIKAGNSLVDENHITDPATIVRDGLSAAMRDAYGIRLLDLDKTPTDEKKAKALAALHPEADYVLDVRSGGWGYFYYPTRWGSYWVLYSAQVQLIDTKTGRQVANEACNMNTREHPNPPSRDQLHANGAQLLKDVTASLGWGCMQLLAKDEMALGSDKVAATPTALVDPISSFAASSAGTSTAPAPATASTTAPAAEPAASNSATEGAQAPQPAASSGSGQRQ